MNHNIKMVLLVLGSFVGMAVIILVKIACGCFMAKGVNEGA